jgi:hypothetical protein
VCCSCVGSTPTGVRVVCVRCCCSACANAASSAASSSSSSSSLAALPSCGKGGGKGGVRLMPRLSTQHFAVSPAMRLCRPCLVRRVCPAAAALLLCCPVRSRPLPSTCSARKPRKTAHRDTLGHRATPHARREVGESHAPPARPSSRRLCAWVFPSRRAPHWTLGDVLWPFQAGGLSEGLCPGPRPRPLPLEGHKPHTQRTIQRQHT